MCGKYIMYVSVPVLRNTLVDLKTKNQALPTVRGDVLNIHVTSYQDSPQVNMASGICLNIAAALGFR